MKQATVNIEGLPHKLNDSETEVYYNLKWREILEDQEGKNYFLLYKKRGKNYVIYLDENIRTAKDESKEVKEGGEGFEGGDLHGMDEVIEALGYLLSSYRADFKNITGAELNDTHAVKYAKYVLNKYPSPKRGRFSY